MPGVEVSLLVGESGRNQTLLVPGDDAKEPFAPGFAVVDAFGFEVEHGNNVFVVE